MAQALQRTRFLDMAADDTEASSVRSPQEGVRILLVDRDPEIRSHPALQMLRRNGFAVDQADSDEHADEALASGDYQLVILDTGADGLDVTEPRRRILEQSAAPVLVWSSGRSPLDQVAALELGAEDYVAKNAHPLVLLARTRLVLRRARGRADRPDAPPPESMAASWTFEPQLFTIRSQDGAAVRLPPSLVRLLLAFCARPREGLSREELARSAIDDMDAVEKRTVDVLVSRLRRRLAGCGGADLIHTLRPSGYFLSAHVHQAGASLVLSAI